jgi:hypothetical protein
LAIFDIAVVDSSEQRQLERVAQALVHELHIISFCRTMVRKVCGVLQGITKTGAK